MKSFWLSDNPPQPSPVDYQSVLCIESKTIPGVTFTIYRVSFGRRLELSRRIRDVAAKLEFLEAKDELRERVEAAQVSSEINNMYLRWGLAGIQGLSIDGGFPDVELLIEKGPEDLAQEIVAAIQAQCQLSGEERKN